MKALNSLTTTYTFRWGSQSGFYTLFQELCFAEKVFTPMLHVRIHTVHEYKHTWRIKCITLAELHLKTLKFQINIIKCTALTQNISYFLSLPLSLLHQSLLLSSCLRIVTGLLKKTQNFATETKIFTLGLIFSILFAFLNFLVIFLHWTPIHSRYKKLSTLLLGVLSDGNPTQAIKEFWWRVSHLGQLVYWFVSASID